MTERAEAGWVEVREDGTPVLCLDVPGGTETYELSPSAAGGLREAFVEGPQVRNDLEGSA